MHKSKYFKLSVFLLSIIPLFFSEFLHLNKVENYIVSILLILISILSYKYIKSIFPAILFFTLVQVLKPLSDEISSHFGLWFAGIYYLLPIVLFTLIILMIKSIRIEITWWNKDKIDKISILLILNLAIISSLALYIWSLFFKNDLLQYIKLFPNYSLVWIIISGLFFALFNAFAEEYLSRGMLCNGLEKIINNKAIIIVIQSFIFGVFHYSGFPGGFTGIIMVFFWSLILGIIRYRTNGILGVLIAHFFSDLTIYFILYSFK